MGPRGQVAPAAWTGAWPFGAMTAATAAAGEALRAAIARIARGAGRGYPSMCRQPGRDLVEFRLGPQPSNRVELGVVDAVSAGAITNSMLFALLRVPDLGGHVVPFDDDTLDVTNLNRYGLMELGDIGIAKVRHLERFSTSSLHIEGRQIRYDEDVRGVSPLMVVGADDIPVRWLAQRRRPDRLGVGATGHAFAIVSSHVPEGPCAGCVHDHDDPAPNVAIPTISVVSFMAGLLLAADLVGIRTGTCAPGRVTSCFPLGLGGRRAYATSPIVPNPRCPVHCRASALAPAA
jgi:hypothetical protein